MGAETPTWDLIMERDAARLRLTGCWSGASALPPADDLLARVTAATPARLELDLADLQSWDTRLPALLYRCRNACRHAGISWEPLSLPPALSDLLQLAQAATPAADGGAAPPPWRSAHALRQALHEIGDEVLASLAFLGDALGACLRALGGRSTTRWVDLRAALFQSGPDALPIISLTSILVGMILAYLGAVQLQQFGAEVYVADLVAIGILREMGVLMTAVVVAGRTGAAYAAQLATMQGNEEIDAVTTLGLSPLEFLVAPRMLALLVTMPLLTVYADLLGIAGGGIVAGGMGISALQYAGELERAFTLDHALIGLGKSVVFAFLIALAGCRAGMSAGRSSAAVGEATTEAVVTAIVYLIVADAAINILCQQLGV